MNVKEKATETLRNLRLHWKTPAEGRYVPYKELLSLAFGGAGMKFIQSCISTMILSVGNSLIGNTIGIDPTPLYVIYLLGILFSIPLTGLRAKIIDNTRSMKGKYRPYVLTMGIPTVILGIGFIWMPYEKMTLLTKCVVVLLFNIGFQFFYNFYYDINDSIVNVLSPNSYERSDVNAVKAIIENISPSIVNIFLPIVAKMITGENTLYDLRVYRIFYPPLLVIGFLISLLIYVGTEEKVVRAKTHVIQVKFADAFRAVARNKYFWIISLAGWLGFLESAFSNILNWQYNYQGAATAGQYAIITAIAGNASFWPNLVAPFLIRKYGKRRILVTANMLNIIFIACMLPMVRLTGASYAIWALLSVIFINQFLSSLGNQMNPSLQADIRDYQQYISGERIDGMFAAVGLIGNIITLATGSVLPMIYEKAGLNKTVAQSLGYDGSNVYDVLYNTDYFISICSVLIIASIIGAAMNVIPFFFYDLTETKQRGMVAVLKIRAMFEDFSNNVLSDKALVETVDIIEDAKEHYGKEIIKPTKDGIKNAKKTHDKEQIKKAKAEYRARIEENNQIEIAEFIMKELHRYETPEGQEDIKNAELIANAGLDGFLSVQSMTKKQAKALPKATWEEQERRRNILMQLSETKAAEKAIKKYFPNGIKEFDKSVFTKLFEEENALELEIHNKLKELKAAKESKNSSLSDSLNSEIKQAQLELKKVRSDIKKAMNENSIYYRAAKPYLDAVKTLAQCENYKHYEKVAVLYNEAKDRIEADNKALLN